MTPRRFSALLRARGPDLTGWAEDDRLAALALLDRSERCRAEFAGAMARETAPEPDPVLTARLQAGLRRRMDQARPAERPRLLPRARPGMAGAFGCGAVAACFAAGLWLGIAGSTTAPSPDLLASVQVGPLALDDR
jgi:hypothetical protein